MNEWDRLWGEHSRLMDRMVEAAHGDFNLSDQSPSGTVRVRLSVSMIFALLLGRVLQFKADGVSILLTRK